MRAVVREGASLVVGLIGIVLLGFGMNHVLDIGSCSSGSSYATVRPCPEGTGSWFWLMMAGAIMWILGIMVSKGVFFAPGAGQVLWTVGFAGGGAAMLVKVLNQPSMPPDSRLGASITAAVFIPMGLVVGIVGVVQLIRRRRAGGNGPRWRRTGVARGLGGRAAAVSTPWSRLKALNDLRSTGALTRAEFSALKTQLADADADAGADAAIDRVALIRELADRRASGALSTGEFEAGKRSIMRQMGEVDAERKVE